MDNPQVHLVQQSFEAVKPISAVAADLFYQRLFELDPTLRALFPDDLTEQKKKLMATLALVVEGLDRAESILPAVAALGKRHVAYGVHDAHYTTVGAALLWTLSQGLGDAFTPEVENAWTAAYMLLATVMQEAAATA